MIQRTLLFTDAVDSTRLIERIGDRQAATSWAEHDRHARRLLAQHRGLEIDRTDGFFLVFADAIDAANFALAYQREVAELGFSVRIGIHTGVVTLRENVAADVLRGAKRIEVEGLAKPFAARVMSLARGGQTLLSAEARRSLGSALPEAQVLEPHGHYRLKGIEEPQLLFELGGDDCAFAPPADTDKAYRVVRAGDIWRPVREVRNNLSPERDAFIGRAAELRRLAQQFDGGARLVNLLGPGGTGKTRIACRYGRTWLGDWPGGVVFCDLSEARSLDGIFFAASLALAVPLGRDDPAAQLGHAVAGRGRCLVILDNFEQVARHAPATLGHWLDRAGDAAFLVTSRERLHLPGEVVFPVEPLALATDAVALFEARARAQRPDFELAAGHRAAVADIVRLLDGLPLAIELAAARVRMLSPSQIVQRLQDRFTLLAGARGVTARQATLRAAIDWSWEMLGPWEQAALAQCSVFDGGFTLEAAEAVLDLRAWPEAASSMDVVQALVDKSLLRVWIPNEQARTDVAEPWFGMYMSIHEYAAEKLECGASGAAGRAQQRHGLYFARLGSDAAIESLYTHGCVERRQILALDIDNLAAACRRAVQRADPEVAVASYRAGWEVLEFRGPFTVGVELGEQLMAALVSDHPLRGKAQAVHALALHRAGRMEAAAKGYADALACARAAQDWASEGFVLVSLANLAREQGRMDEARTQFEAAVTIYQALGHRRAQAVALGNLGTVHLECDRIESAREVYEAALALHRAVGNRRDEAVVLGNLGSLHAAQGRMPEACAHYDEAILIHREVGNRRFEGTVLLNRASLEAMQGRLDDARGLFQVSLSIIREVGSRSDEGSVLANLGNLEADLGRPDVARAYFDSALAIRRELGERRSEAAVLSSLGQLHFRQGRLDEAVSHFRQALDISRETGSRRQQGSLLGHLASVHIVHGRTGEAQAALGEGEALLRSIGDLLRLALLLCVRARAELSLGERARAEATVVEAESLAAAISAGTQSELMKHIESIRGQLA